MFKNRIFSVLVVVALLAVAALTAWEAAAIADVVSDDQGAPAVSIVSRDRPVGQDTIGPAPSHRSPGDECFDVSLSEVAECRRAIQAPDLPLSRAPLAPAPAHRAPIDECFDVSLSELADCRLTSRKPSELGEARAYPRRHPLNECFDVPLSEVCDQ